MLSCESVLVANGIPWLGKEGGRWLWQFSGCVLIVRPEDAKASYCEMLSGGAGEAAVSVGVMVGRLAAWEKRR